MYAIQFIENKRKVTNEGANVSWKQKKLSVKEYIKTAFLQLLSIKPFHEITITDIVRRAGVSRVSFYRNFQNIDDVIISVIHSFNQKIENNIVPLLSHHNKTSYFHAMLISFLKSIKQNKKMFTTMLEINRSILFERFQSVFDSIKPISSKEKTLAERYDMQCKIGLISEVTKAWIINDLGESAEEIADYIMNQIAKLNASA